MSEDDFLSRWSRRKRSATESAKESPKTLMVPAQEQALASVGPEKKPEEEFDLSTLPPIESITSATDVSVFLRKGVPLELSRAALRRAWSADPAIRDFVGLAENAWDFNDPTAMPGFGPLDQSPEEVRRMLARVMGEILPPEGVDETPAGNLPAAATATELDSTHVAVDVAKPSADAQIEGQIPSPSATIPSSEAERNNDNSRRQESLPTETGPQSMVHRTHGGALPR